MKDYLPLAVVLVAVIVASIGGYMIFSGAYSENQNSAGQPEAQQMQNENNVREVYVTAKQWSFEPSEIRVKLGERVRLRIKSVDVAHGINIADFGIDSYLEPGKETVIEFDANKPGRFPFFCSVYCGEGHGNMRGYLVVEEA